MEKQLDRVRFAQRLTMERLTSEPAVSARRNGSNSMLTNYGEQPYGDEFANLRKKDLHGNKLSSNTQVFQASDILPDEQYRSKSHIASYRKSSLSRIEDSDADG